jgi:hypothetical protein
VVAGSVMVGFCWGFGSRWIGVACGGFVGWFVVGHGGSGWFLVDPVVVSGGLQGLVCLLQTKIIIIITIIIINK